MDEADRAPDAGQPAGRPGVWTCASCTADYDDIDEEPLYVDEFGSKYCTECVEVLFHAIADGNEDTGLPTIHDTSLIDQQRVMEGINPALRARFEAGLVRLSSLEIEPVHHWCRER